MGDWTEADVPEQHGRTAVVTGGNTGIGFETARVLAQRGARVVLACRSLDRAKQAADRIDPNGDIDVLHLDLASLKSVRAAASELTARYDRIDLLINNAGVTATSGQTEDGFEIQFGINHLGHFAFTGLVLDLLLPVPGSRVVTVGSIMHKRGRVDPDDPTSFRGYPASKLANLLFTLELHRRLAGANTIALAAHPGGASTDVLRDTPKVVRVSQQWFARAIGRTAAMGALPSLRAATDAEALGGEYYGPDGFLDIMGHPVRVEPHPRAHDTDVQRRLWDASAALTGVDYPV